MISRSKSKTSRIFVLFVIFNSIVQSFCYNESIFFRAERLFNHELVQKISDFMVKDHESYDSSCRNDILTWAASLSQITTQTWALRMLDSGGRLPSGILKGNLNSLGDFDECLQVNHVIESTGHSIKGKYCLAGLPVPLNLIGDEISLSISKTAFPGFNFNPMGRLVNIGVAGLVINIAICIPSSCKGSDLTTVLNGLGRQNPRINFLTNVSVPEDFCKTSDPAVLSPGAWVTVSLLIFIGVLLILSTSYDLYFSFIAKEPEKINLLLSSFSVWKNSKKVFSVNPRPGPLRCVHGIRVLSMFWIILCHRYSTTVTFPVLNPIDFFKWVQTYASLPIIAASVSVDSFFVISGLLLSYLFFKQMEKEKCFNVPMFYVHRILRLTPAVGMMVLLETTVMKYVGTGPLWNFFRTFIVQNFCDKWWWTTLLYVQNYVNPAELCVGQTWYLAVDMQLYILSPLLLYPLLKWPRWGMVWTAWWTIAATLSMLVYCLIYEWPAGQVPLNGSLEESTRRGSLTYAATHTRAATWLLGFIAGYYLNISLKRKRYFNTWLVIAGWLASLAIMGAVIFGMHPFQQPSHKFSHAADTTYLVLSRVAWAVALLWVIVACSHGYGGPVNWFLSLRIWEVLGHLSFTMYLVHLTIIYAITFSNKNIAMFSNLNTVHLFFGDLIFTIIFAYILTIICESPILAIEGALRRKGKPQILAKDDPPTEADTEISITKDLKTINKLMMTA